MRKKVLLLFCFLVLAISYGQSPIWQKTTESETRNLAKMERSSVPSRFELFSLNLSALKSQLSNAPLDSSNINSTLVISFPNPNGELSEYRIYEAPVMEEGLAVKFPGIKSYSGKNLRNPAETIRFSVTLFGLHVMSFSGESGTYFIDTYTKDLNNYIVYRKADVTPTTTLQCHVSDDPSETVEKIQNSNLYRASDSFFRTYRLAMACTIEYAAFHVTAAGLGGGTLAQKKAAVLSAMVVTMTRVNGVFEKDMALRMNLVANNDLVIFIDSDSFDNANSGTLINQSQTVIDANIGAANYDIGHTVSTGGGGLAQLFSPCTANKARGITGQGSPVGDPFDIDYVAHEMGHQWGANHTQNNACNRNAATAVEPGSASTIMGYAGICAPNVQSNSDAYFHTVSVSEMIAFVSGGTGGTCAVAVANGNSAPIVNAGIDYTIPRGTAFILKGTGSDANGDTLTYCWEQTNNQTSTQPPTQTATTGPNFRSLTPSLSPDRYMPPLASVVAGNLAPTWEVVPNVARTMNFALTARDNRTPNGGQTARDNMILTVASVGPFLVTSPNTAVSYAGNTTQTFTWDVAGTTANGINCANVDIYLSTNGGLTFPILLQLGTPNDGTQAINIPNLPGATNRIMIIGSNHIFYDVSNVNFTITAGTPETTAPTAPTLTASGTTQTTTVLSWSGATDNIAVTGYNIYQGATLIGTSVSSPFTVTGLTPGTTYTFTVRAKDADGNLSVPSNAVNVTTQAPDTTPPSPPTLTASGTTSTSTVLSWSGATDNIAVTGYNIYQGATQIGTTTTATTFTVTGLTPSTTYSFKVKAKDAANNLSSDSNIVNVTTAAPDVTPPSAPILTFTAKTANTVSLSWSGATDNVAVTGYDVYQGATLIGSTATTTFVASGLTASTTYSFTVRAKDAAGNISVPSNVLSVTTDAFNYCASQGNSVADELIGNVQLGTINNASTGGSGYTDFTSISTNLTLGSTNTITITPTWTSTVYPEGYGVFIDYNRDGDFVDVGETVWTLAATTSTPVSGTFTVPATATLGQTRMRVTLKYNGIPTPCETFSFGQVEDYTINLVSSTAIVNLNLFIEGYFDYAAVGGNIMNPVLANQTGSGFFANVEEIQVELHHPTTLGLVSSVTGTLYTDGTIQVGFEATTPGQYYIVVKGNNFIETWSATPQTMGAVPLFYDFTSAASQAFGSNMKEVRPGVWAFYSGDINQDGNIDNTDYSNWEVDANNFESGSFVTDLNGDGNVDNSDFSIWENNANNFIFVITP
jgi:chitodextrinase